MEINKRIRHIIGVVFLIAVVFLMAIPFVFGSNRDTESVRKLTEWQLNNEIVELPLSLNLAEDEDKITLTKELSYNGEEHLHMLFSVKYDAVKLYVDDKLVYESEPLKFGMKSAGVVSSLIDLHTVGENSTLRLELYPYLEGNYAANIDAPIVGDSMGILNYIFSREWIDIVMETIMIVMGILLIALNFLIKKEESKKLDFLMLGILSIMGGAYTLVQSSFIKIVISNSYFLYYVEFTTLMLIPLVVSVLMIRNISSKMRKVFYALQILLVTNFVAQHVCHFILHIEFRELLLMTHICIFMVVVACAVAILTGLKEMSKKNKETMKSIAPVLFGGSADLALSYFGINESYYSAFYFKLGLFIFIFMQVYYNYHRFIFNLNEKLMMETYRQLAYTDGLTKLNNRLAFETDLKLINENKHRNVEVTCVSIDINGLKEVNDSMGHAKGDELIIAVASILERSIDKESKIYRIGGDEFIVLMASVEHQEVKTFLERLENERKLEEEKHEFKISYATGYSIYQKVDENAEKMIARADKEMYENKRSFKKGILYPII